MSFESVYRSKQGTKEINKIANFIGSLVIKNEYEARRDETVDSLANYYDYHGAYTKTDEFANYDLDFRRKYSDYCYKYMISLNRNYNLSLNAMQQLTNSRIKTLQSEFDNKNLMYIDYLNALRSARITYYDEKNLYYRQFLGIPNTDDDIVYVINMDEGEFGYTKVADFSVPPDPKLIYFRKVNEEEFETIGNLESWFVENPDGTTTPVSDSFYYINMVAIHLVKKSILPITYNYLILQQNIKTVIEEHSDLSYIRFVGKEYTPFYLRSLPNYSIIDYDNNYLSSTELSYFFKAYNKAKQQVIMDYINGFDSKQPMYNLLMIQNLLYFTVINYSNSYIERYSVGIYTEENCNNILKSNGYNSLVEIEDLELKQRIVKNLDELIENKGNNYILEIILNKILQDSNSELKRYYLEKKYTTDENLSIKIDTSKGLEKSIDLVLREVPAISNNELSVSADNYFDYDVFVDKDDSWGGIEENDSDAIKVKKKEMLKRKLQSIEFDSILTKYITLTRTVDILESQRQLRDTIYLMLSYFDFHNSPEFFTKKIVFDTIEVTPAALFGAMCWLQQMKFYDNHDKIISDNCVINSSVVFRKMGSLSIDTNKLHNNVVIINGKPVVTYDITPEIGSWKVVDFIKENPEEFSDLLTLVQTDDRLETCRLLDVINSEGSIKEKGILTFGYIPRDGYKHLNTVESDIEDYLVRFRYYSEGKDLGEVTASTTFEELINDYKHQYSNLINRITKKLHSSYDYREYQAWMYMLEQSRTNNSVEFIFKGCESFSEYIVSMESAGLVDYIAKATGYLTWSKRDMKKICDTLDTINNAFKDWVTNSFSDLVYGESEEDSSKSSYVKDMTILFNEFLSVYSKLYSVNYNYTFGNVESEGLYLQLFYNPLSIKFADKFYDHIGLEHKLKSNIAVDYLDKIDLYYRYTTKQYDSFRDNINNGLIFDIETNQYICEDQFRYSYTTSIHDKHYDYVGLDYNTTNINAKCLVNDTISLSGVLKITPLNEETKTYYET